MKVQMFQGADGWRWHLVAGNGEILATSEAYDSRSNAERTAQLVQGMIVYGEAPDEEVADGGDVGADVE